MHAYYLMVDKHCQVGNLYWVTDEPIIVLFFIQKSEEQGEGGFLHSPCLLIVCLN